MISENSAGPSTLWLVPQLYFQVEWDSEVMSFQEVSGLENEAQSIEHGEGSPVFSAVKIPGVVKGGIVTLKRGVFISDTRAMDWFNTMEMNLQTIIRKQVTITLLDEAGATTMAWMLKNAWPAQVQYGDSNSAGSRVAIESLKVAHEGIERING